VGHPQNNVDSSASDGRDELLEGWETTPEALDAAINRQRDISEAHSRLAHAITEAIMDEAEQPGAATA
jgi:hypothetical protein